MDELRLEPCPLPKYGTKLYWVWVEMKKRCEKPYHKKYHRYGGRGIKVCPKWHSYSEFHKWALSSGYSEGLTIDRIDNDGNYEPKNCRWATQLQQSRNTCQNVPISAFGRTMLVGEWSEITGVNKGTMGNRIRRGMNIEDAITLPPMSAKESGRKGKLAQIMSYATKPETEGD